MRELLQAESQGDERAALAVEMFCYRARKYVGAYLAALGGADALVFGGGIGENAPVIRSRICDSLGWCGLTLDPDRSARMTGSEGRISAEDSKVQAYVIAVDEESVIARDTERCLRGGS
jgi:acetate kinase